eukprot:scaffold155683_cov19-Prasinocladus_malaysianus.AAC.2
MSHRTFQHLPFKSHVMNECRRCYNVLASTNNADPHWGKQDRLCIIAHTCTEMRSLHGTERRSPRGAAVFTALALVAYLYSHIDCKQNQIFSNLSMREHHFRLSLSNEIIPMFMTLISSLEGCLIRL